MGLDKNVEPQKDAPVYGAFGSAFLVFGRANGEAAIDYRLSVDLGCFRNLVGRGLAVRSGG